MLRGLGTLIFPILFSVTDGLETIVTGVCLDKTYGFSMPEGDSIIIVGMEYALFALGCWFYICRKLEEDMNNIQNLDRYIRSMSTTIKDKLWWVDIIPDEIDTVIDFGCAQGDLALMLSEKHRYIGIDNSPGMLQLARHNHILHFERQSEFYPSLNEANGKYNPSTTVLVLNSVMHEIFSYLSSGEINALFKEMFESGIRCIAIRDMHLPDMDSVCKICTHICKERIEQSRKYSKLWAGYIDYMMHGRNGEECRQRRFAYDCMRLYIAEFLLKYRYFENWRRELREYYLWPWLEMISGFIKDDGHDTGFYTIAYEHEFRIPFIVGKIKEDFDIDFDLDTHRKVLLIAV